MPIFEDNSLTVGRTPLVKLRRVTEGLSASILVKLEGRNFSYSIKGRCAPAMLDSAERSGALAPGKTVLEATSGSTGIALAFTCAVRGYSLTLTMPDSVSPERIELLEAFGTNIVLTSGDDRIPGAIAKAKELEQTGKYCYLNQFSNSANVTCHFEGTAPEIWHDTEGKADILISCVGSGGTLTGIAKYFKVLKHRPLHCVAVEPVNCAVLSGGKPGRHQITGIAPGFISEILDLRMIDEVVTVTEEEAFELTPRIAREEGIFCGISGGAALAAALKVAKRPECIGKTIVVVIADSGERYTSAPLLQTSVRSRGTRAT